MQRAWLNLKPLQRQRNAVNYLLDRRTLQRQPMVRYHVTLDYHRLWIICFVAACNVSVPNKVVKNKENIFCAKLPSDNIQGFCSMCFYFCLGQLASQLIKILLVKIMSNNIQLCSAKETTNQVWTSILCIYYYVHGKDLP